MWACRTHDGSPGYLNTSGQVISPHDAFESPFACWVNMDWDQPRDCNIEWVESPPKHTPDVVFYNPFKYWNLLETHTKVLWIINFVLWIALPIFFVSWVVFT